MMGPSGPIGPSSSDPARRLRRSVKICDEQAAAENLICHNDQSDRECMYREVGRRRVERMEKVEQRRGRGGRRESGDRGR